MCQASNISCNCGCSQPTGLGLTANGKRSIKSGREFDHLFDMSQLKGTDPIVKQNGDTFDTLREMEKLAKSTRNQTGKLARHIKGSSLIVTLSNLWHFLYNHVQYKPDAKFIEQLRTPVRVWKNRKTGVDCDCYSIFISSVLHNLGIPHAFRMTKYGNDWQHVYVVVPKDGKKSSLKNRSKYYVIDPVVNSFNYEVPPSEIHDRFMNTPIQILNGLNQVKQCKDNSSRPKPPETIRAQAIVRDGLVVTEDFLKEQNIPFKKITNEQGKPAIAVETGGGSMVKIPTVISKEASNQIKNSVDAAMSITSVEDPAEMQAGMGKGWIVALVIIALGIAVLHSARPETLQGPTVIDLR